MSWYRIILKLKSPLHVGDVPLGFVQRTRYYLPARAIWGALTAEKSRRETVGFPQYQKVGDYVTANFNFTHFFLATEKKDDYSINLPNYGSEALMYGSLSRSEFGQKFISSFGQTALDPARLAADEHSLHEKEVISHLTLDDNDNVQPVFLCGYVFCKKDDCVSGIECLDGCQLGADRRNGLGKIGKVEALKMKDGDCAWNVTEINFKGNKLEIKEKTPFPCHVPVKADDGICGDIEYLQWRSWDDKNGPGRKRESAKESPNLPCWVPGSFSEAALTLEYGEHGIFKVQQGGGHDGSE